MLFLCAHHHPTAHHPTAHHGECSYNITSYRFTVRVTRASGGFLFFCEVKLLYRAICCICTRAGPINVNKSALSVSVYPLFNLRCYIDQVTHFKVSGISGDQVQFPYVCSPSGMENIYRLPYQILSILFQCEPNTLSVEWLRKKFHSVTQ